MKYLLLILLAACGTFLKPKPSPRNTSDLQRLTQRVDLYKEIHNSTADEWGFVDVKHCDSLLFSGLVGIAVTVDLQAAEEKPGKWLRRPTSYPECWENGLSRSEISRDGLMGVMWWAFFNDRRDVLEDLWSYGEKRAWIMGNGRAGGVDSFFNPQYVGLLAELIYFMGGEDYSFWRSLTGVSKSCEYYTCHLQVLYLDLLGRAQGGLKESQVEILKATATKYPENLYFHYAAHRYTDQDSSEIIKGLLENYPKTGPVLCEFWPMQQNGDDYWRKSCALPKNTGADFLFLSSLILLDAYD